MTQLTSTFQPLSVIKNDLERAIDFIKSNVTWIKKVYPMMGYERMNHWLYDFDGIDRTRTPGEKTLLKPFIEGLSSDKKWDIFIEEDVQPLLALREQQLVSVTEIVSLTEQLHSNSININNTVSMLQDVEKKLNKKNQSSFSFSQAEMDSLEAVINIGSIKNDIKITKKNGSKYYQLSRELVEAAFETAANKLKWLVSTEKSLNIEIKEITSGLGVLENVVNIEDIESYTTFPVDIGRTLQTLTTQGAIMTLLCKLLPEEKYDKISSQIEQKLMAYRYHYKSSMYVWNDSISVTNNFVDYSMQAHKRIDELDVLLKKTFSADNFKDGSAFNTRWQEIKGAFKSYLSITSIEKMSIVLPGATKGSSKDFLAEIDKNFISILENQLTDAIMETSEYGKTKQSFKNTSNQLKAERVVSSFFSLSAIMSKIRESTSLQGSEQAIAITTAITWFASAMNVPWSTAWEMVEEKMKTGGKGIKDSIVEIFDSFKKPSANASDMKKNHKAISESLKKFLPKKTTSTSGKYIANNSNNVVLLSYKKIDPGAYAGSGVRELSLPNEFRFVKSTKYGLNTKSNLLKSAGKNSFSFVSSIMGLGLSVEMLRQAASDGAVNADDIAEGVLGLLGASAFLAADMNTILATGRNATRTTYALLGVGAVLGSITGAVSIKKSVDYLRENPNSLMAQMAVADSVIMTVTSIAALAVGVVCPPAALAFLAIPNFAAIGQAIELKTQIDDYRRKGLNHDAEALDTLYKIAAMNATPIVNWFSAIYTQEMKNNIYAGMARNNNDWYYAATIERMNYLLTGPGTTLVSSLKNVLAENNAWRINYILGSTQQFTYYDEEHYENIDVVANLIVDNAGGVRTYYSFDRANFGFSLAGAPSPSEKNKDKSNLMLVNADGTFNKKRNIDCYGTLQGSQWVVMTNMFNIASGQGDDVFLIDPDADGVRIDGNKGNDIVIFSPSEKEEKPAGRKINMDHFKNIEMVYGTQFADTVSGKGGFYHYGGGRDVITMAGNNTSTVVAGTTSKVILGDGDDELILLKNDLDGNTRGFFDGGKGEDTLRLTEIQGEVTFSKDGNKWGVLTFLPSDDAQLKQTTDIRRFGTILGSDAGGNYTITKAQSGGGVHNLILGNGNDNVMLNNTEGTVVSLGGGTDVLSVQNSKEITVFTAGTGDQVTVKNSQVSAVLAGDNETITFTGKNEEVGITVAQGRHNISFSQQTSSYIQIDGNYKSKTMINVAANATGASVIALSAPFISMGNTYVSMSDRTLEIGSISSVNKKSTSDKYNNLVYLTWEGTGSLMSDQSSTTKSMLVLEDSGSAADLTVFSMDSLIQAMSSFGSDGSDNRATRSLDNGGGVSLYELATTNRAGMIA